MLALATIPIFLGYALAAPTPATSSPDCTPKVDAKPWNVTNWIAFQADSPATQVSSFTTFDLSDINEGLEMQTTCNRTLPVESTAGITSPDYYFCNEEHQDVRFIYDGVKLAIERAYNEPCNVAPYQGRIAFGSQNLDVLVRNVAVDEVATQEVVIVDITQYT